MIFGYLLRDMSDEFEIIKRRHEEKLKECKKIGKAFISDGTI